MNNSRLELGKKLKKVRDERNLTQAAVASQSEIHVNYYARIERGEENPSFDILQRVMKVLKIKTLELY